MQQGYTHINEIIEKTRKEGFENIHESDAKEFVWDVFGFIAVPSLFEQKTDEIEVKQYKGQLPVDFYSLAEGGIRDKKTKHVFRPSTDLFHKLNRQQDKSSDIVQKYGSTYYEWDENKEEHISNSDEATYLIGRTGSLTNPEDFTYMLERDIIFIPFEERTLEISYKAFPIYQEDMTPKIPNDAKVIDLIVSYLKHKLSEKMLLQGTIDMKIAAKLEQDYLFRAASTRSSQLMNSPNEMENAKNQLLSLVPRSVSFRHGHRFKGQDTL